VASYDVLFAFFYYPNLIIFGLHISITIIHMSKLILLPHLSHNVVIENSGQVALIRMKIHNKLRSTYAFLFLFLFF